MTQHKLVRRYDEVENIQTFVFEKADTSWLAGQYQTYVLPQAGGDENNRKRWFTIASAPSEQEVHISTRVTDSAFKQALNSLQLGDTIEAHSVEGDFTWEDEEPVVLVAGGIGVTPYRSILLERIAQKKSVNATLLYFGRSDQFAFRTELEALVNDHPELSIYYITGEHISADSILRFAPHATDQTIYLSGPEEMVDSVGDELTGCNIRLKQDWFPGYTVDTY